jgi:hypothetical protein
MQTNFPAPVFHLRVVDRGFSSVRSSSQPSHLFKSRLFAHAR